jgi:hypothetical protein
MLSVLVFILDTVPLMLPLILSESGVIGEAVDEEVASCDGIVDGEAGRVTDSIGVRRELSAFEEEGTDKGEFFKGGYADFNHAGLNLSNVDLASNSNSFESVNILSTDDVVSLVLGIDTTLVTDEFFHGLKSCSVGGHDDDLFVSSEGASHSGELGESTHEHRLVSDRASKVLLPHHETTVTSDSAHILLVH